jgi:hypothetical protein
MEGETLSAQPNETCITQIDRFKREFWDSDLTHICHLALQHVYLVNDYGNDPPSDSPALFCKSHLLARFDLGASA